MIPWFTSSHLLTSTTDLLFLSFPLVSVDFLPHAQLTVTQLTLRLRLMTSTTTGLNMTQLENNRGKRCTSFLPPSFTPFHFSYVESLLSSGRVVLRERESSIEEKYKTEIEADVIMDDFLFVLCRRK